MLCQNCNSQNATTHIKRIINGKKEEMYLCQHCANELGYNDIISNMNLGSFLGNFLGASTDIQKSLAGVERCEMCGSSYSDIVSLGKVGCANCYDKFYDKLIGSIENIHGRAKHVGKVTNKAYVPEQESTVDKLSRLLKQAIDEQNFEKAAKLRDKINELKETQDNE